MPPTPITFSVSAPPPGVLTAGISKGRFITVNLAAPMPSKPTKVLPPPTANQRRKARKVEAPVADHGSTMTPLNVTIIERCLARVDPPSPPNSNKKRSSNQTSPTPSLVPPSVHPYSRQSDLANTRSTIPSPQELARAERAEEEKARQKRENAAQARHAAALARRRKAGRSGRGTSRVPSSSAAPATMIPAIQRAVAIQRAKSAEAAAAEAHAAESGASAAESSITTTVPTAEPEDEGGRPSRNLKRTRSSGLLSISTSVTPGTVGVASPLRTVTNPSDDASVKPTQNGEADGTDGGAPARKRSRLADPLPARAPSARRPNTASPPGVSTPLDSDTSPDKPVKPESLSPTEPTSSMMRRAVSATDAGRTRRPSFGTDALRERSRREVVLPARMRDYA